MTKIIWAFLCLTVACRPVDHREIVEHNPLADGVFFAHRGNDLLENEAICFQFAYAMGDEPIHSGTMCTQVNAPSAKLWLDNTAFTLWDGEHFWYRPDSANILDTSSKIKAWKYFFLSPYSFVQPEARWHFLGKKELQQKSYQTGYLSFTQDHAAPHQWYKVFADAESMLLKIIAYPEQSATSRGAAASASKAVTFSDFQLVEGIPFAHRWQFWTWSNEAGLQEPIGELSLTSIEFVLTDNLFDVPEDAIAWEE